MKTIITLGLVALVFTTTQAANEFKTQDLNQQEVATLLIDSGKQDKLVLENNEFSQKGIENNSEETTVFNPNSVIKTTYVKSTEEVVAESKLITESQEVITQPLSIEKTVSDYITEDNQVIESTINNTIYPLDFEKINRAVKNGKIVNNNLAVTVDLKL